MGLLLGYNLHRLVVFTAVISKNFKTSYVVLLKHGDWWRLNVGGESTVVGSGPVMSQW